MAGLLAAMAGLVIAAFIWSHREIRAIETNISIADAYHQTAMNAALASVHASSFAETGDAAELTLFGRALKSTLEYEEQVKRLGDDEDRAFLAGLEAQYAAELASARQMIQAIDSGAFAELPIEEFG